MYQNQDPKCDCRFYQKLRGGSLFYVLYKNRANVTYSSYLGFKIVAMYEEIA
jgi:hypothetical protein